MILSNTEIHKAIIENRIILEPAPKTEFDSTAVDLRFGNIIQEPNQLLVCIDPQRESIVQTLNTIYSTKTIEDAYVLDPGEFILGKTFEKIHLPFEPDERGYYLAARVEGKSSLARCGLLIHFTAPTIHAGFKGTITLEIINLGAFSITLRPNMPICQLIFETVLGKPEENPSVFHGQTHPSGLQ